MKSKKELKKLRAENRRIEQQRKLEQDIKKERKRNAELKFETSIFGKINKFIQKMLGYLSD